MCLDFTFFLKLCPFESWSNPRFDHDLNKFVYQLECLLYDIRRLCVWFLFFWICYAHL